MDGNLIPQEPFFIERAKKVFVDFATLEKNFSGTLNEKHLPETLYQAVREVLSHVLASPSFTLSLSDDRSIHVELRCDLDHLLLFEETEFLSLIPEGRHLVWKFSLSSVLSHDFILEMDGQVVESDSVLASVVNIEGEGACEVILSNQQLFALYKQNPSAALDIAWQMLCLVLGEVPVMACVSRVMISSEADGLAVSINDLKIELSHILSPSKASVNALRYLDTWLTYREVESDGGCRGRVLFGSTCFLETIDAYHAGDMSLVQQAARDGVGLGFIKCAFPSESGYEKAIEMRERLIDLMDDRMTSDVYRLIGTGIAADSFLIDVLVWDFDGFSEGLSRILASVPDLGDSFYYPFCKDASPINVKG